ncbi:sulfite exporter TauE/SafE family protein [Cloacibacterium sp.]|uniref:sulfite exporter TauE/SafE family protein n=1 Tax=Cloacibacterium sp. TaxID=1913682 RepID=UPI0039E229B9
MEITLIFAALGLGFASGFHCLGMCGPIALSLGLSKKQQVNFHLQNLTYQLGRILTYSFLGAIVGIVGEGFQLAGFQKYISILAGILLITMALFSFGGDFTSKIPAISNALLKVKINLGKLLRKTDYSSRFLTGILNGFLPCGMVYMALTASLAAGGIWQSSTFMVFFGLGTFPFMFAAVLFGNILNATVRNKILKIVPVFMLILGALFILRGMELGIPYVSPKKEALKVEKHMNSDKNSNENCH